MRVVITGATGNCGTALVKADELGWKPSMDGAAALRLRVDGIAAAAADARGSAYQLPPPAADRSALLPK